MFTNDTFVANHAITSNGHSTFSVPTMDTMETEEIDDILLIEAKHKKSNLTYYKPLSLKINWEKTFKLKIVKISLKIGDIIDFITRLTGIKKLIIKLTNGNCGCEQRRKKFNKWFFIPVVKFWFDELDYDDKLYVKQKQRKVAVKAIKNDSEMFYQKIKQNIVQQYAIKDHMDTGKIIADWPQKNDNTQPKSGGCGCGNKFKKTVTYL